MSARDAGSQADHADFPVWHIRRHWRLVDMMNFVLKRFMGALKAIDQEIGICGARSGGSVLMMIAEDDKARMLQNLNFVEIVCKEMNLIGAKNRLERIGINFKLGITYHALSTELVVLKQAIEDDVKLEYFYHYPKKFADIFNDRDKDWEKTLKAFPSKAVRFEIESGIDTYALGHPTAAVFHFMRIAEFGLRALARVCKVKLKKGPIEWQTWQDLITAINKRAEQILQNQRKGPKKDAALGFYNGAVQHFAGFKDQYRNAVSHARVVYAPWQAEMAMRQVRDFMNSLSEKIGENAKGRIKW